MALSRLPGSLWPLRLILPLIFLVMMEEYWMPSPRHEQSVVSEGGDTKADSLLDRLGIHPRPFLPWKNPLPCFPRENNKTPQSLNGFLFVKIPKTGKPGKAQCLESSGAL